MDPESTRRYFNQCDPNESLKAGDPRYEPFDEAELRGEAPCDRLLNVVAQSDKPTTQLLSGLMGSGKTTELRRFCESAQSQACFVAMTDVVEREVALVDSSRPPKVVDTLVAVCWAVTEALALDRRFSSKVKDAVDLVWSALNARLRLPELGLKLEGSPPTAPNVKAALEAKLQFLRQPTVREKLSRSYDESPVRFRQEVVAFVEDSIHRVLQEGLGSKLVVVLDGLEKTADSSVDAETKEDACREAFLDNSHALRLPCHLVYTIPPFMIQYGGELGRLYDSELVFLPMVRIVHRDGTPDEGGVRRLLHAISRRMPLDAFQREEVARMLVEASGGSLRDVLRLLRECLLRCPQPVDAIDDTVARSAIRRLQRSYREAFKEEFRDPLTRTMANRKRFLHSDGNHKVFGELLRSQIMLRYHNEDEWYDVHPLARHELEAAPVTLPFTPSDEGSTGAIP